MKNCLRFLIILILTLFCKNGTADSIVSQDKTIFILHSYHQEYPWTSNQNKGFIKALTKSYVSGDMKFSTEYLDTKRINFSPKYKDFFYLYLKQKYANYSPDIIFCTDDNALNFLMQFKVNLFGNSPVVFCGVNNLNIQNDLDRREYTGIFEKKEFSPNLKLIKKILPEPGKILLIGDGSSTSKAIEKQVRKDLKEQMPIQDFEFLVDSKFTSIINQLKLKKKGILFLTTVGGMKDENNEVVPLKKTIRSIVNSGRFTIISMEDAYLQDGILGGYVTSGFSQGKEAANVALKIFKGESVFSIPLVEESPNQYMFNYPQLKKFGLSISQLPKESIIYNKPVSFYDIYKYKIWFAMLFLGLQTIIIIFLTQNIQSRKKAQLLLKQSQQELSLKVEERTSELTKTNKNLKNEIHEHKQTEKSLESQNLLMTTLLDNLQVGVFMIEAPSGKPLLANQIAKKILGRGIIDNADKSNITEVYQAYKSGTDELYPQSELPIVLGLMGESHTIDNMVIVQPDGKQVYLEVFGSPVKNKSGDIISSLVSFSDITDRKKAEIELKKSESKYRTLFENMTQGVFYQRANGEIFDFNKNALDMFGLTSDQFLGKISFDPTWRIIHEDGSDYPGEQHPSIVALATGKPVLDAIAGIFNPTKNDFVWLNINATPQFKNGESKPYQVFVTLHDITDLRKAEAEVRQAHKMESIGTLAGGIAHDFNNILGIIVGNTELALDDVPKGNSAHSSLEEIKKASLRAKNIVKQLLSFSRKTDQKLQPIQIASVIKDALKFLRSTIPSTINIHQDIQTTDEMILADSIQINQIIMNLCINASHAMEQTGGDLIVNVERVILDYQLFKDYPDLKSGDHVKIMVSDTGPGIDPEIIDQIFDPYFTTKEVGKGSGMGLAVVHGIVKNYNGAISVDSSQGKGTKFSILFPLTSEKPEIEAQTNKDIPRGNETILFVDDEISITKMVKRMFERLGYKVETATTPQDALERFSLNPDHFDLVITDMTMPQMTGVKLSEKLMEIRPDIPIIICTGHSALVDEERAKDLNLAAYVMKPIDMQETAQTIRKVLDKK